MSSKSWLRRVKVFITYQAGLVPLYDLPKMSLNIDLLRERASTDNLSMLMLELTEGVRGQHSSAEEEWATQNSIIRPLLDRVRGIKFTSAFRIKNVHSAELNVGPLSYHRILLPSLFERIFQFQIPLLKGISSLDRISISIAERILSIFYGG